MKRMKHAILEEVWRVRDKISTECGHDVKQLAALLRANEAKYADRLVRVPVQRHSKSRSRKCAPTPA